MSLLGRLRSLLARLPGASQPAAPEPTTAVELEYQRQLQTLETVRRSIVEVLTSRKRLEAQAEQLRRTHDQLEAQASAAVAETQDDLARSALTQALDVERRLMDRQKVIDGLHRQERELWASSRKLQAHIEQYRARMEAAQARHAAAEAGTRAETMTAKLSRDPQARAARDPEPPGSDPPEGGSGP